MDYELIRSARRTLSLRVNRDGSLTVRAPRLMPKARIEAFLRSKEKWIAATRARLSAAGEKSAELLTEEERRELTKKGREVFPPRAAHYASLLGVSYGRIALRFQRSRWGSCSGKGNLNFNCLLLLAPPEVLDSVVAHEVCHLKEPNHSPRFYELVRSVCPDYDACSKWLKTNGPALLARLPETQE